MAQEKQPLLTYRFIVGVVNVDPVCFGTYYKVI